MIKKLKYILAFLILGQMTYAQSIEQMYKYRSEPKGNIQYRREGKMEGNRVRTLFQNQGEVGHWPFSPSAEWPKGSGVNNIDGVCALVASEVTLPDNMVIHPLQTSYREWMDKDPLTGEIWGFEPIPGYTNEVKDVKDPKSPALATNPKTWPEMWPRALPIENPEEWDGNWYGYFGNGVKNSDEETFYAMDDSKDGEWKRAPYNYFPIKTDSAFGGLGLHVEVRGFQWSHVLAEDIIFWHYDIVNISDNDHPKTFFGFYTDVGSGGETSSPDNAYYDKDLDIAYGWDDKGIMPSTNKKIGYTGWAYLESPGNSFDGLDNDNDGIVDERRDNDAGTFGVTPIGKYGDPVAHWSGDENGDWISFGDLNDNGKWDSQNEPLNDDVGSDGIGPYDEKYEAPDQNGTEGNGRPDDGEPHFGKTDKNESDQIGLTALSIYILGDGGVGGGWPKDDESMWNKMSSGNFDTQIQQKNISMVFASGPFPLKQALRERFSMALVFGNDLDALLFNKETVQQIYNANYNFSKPPYKPTVKAVAGDRKVFLYWDKKAEDSRDAFLGFEQGNPSLGYKKDFEGYLIYRSTDPEFNNIKTITDSKAEPKYWKPIAQFDLRDSVKGPDPVGINGASFWRGENSGLTHSYIDTLVNNGQTYYYAVVSYDMGDPNFGTRGLQPSECTKIISVDFAGVLNFVDINCAVVVPNAPVAGYKSPQIEGSLKKVAEGVGSGSISVSVLNPAEIKDGTVYKVKFNSEGIGGAYKTSSFDIIRIREGVTDTLQAKNDTTMIGPKRSTMPFDGLTVSVINDTTALVDNLTGWLAGKSNLAMSVTPSDNKQYGAKWPCDYRIEFLAGKTVPSFDGSIPANGPVVNFVVINTTRQDTVPVLVNDLNSNSILDVGEDFSIVEFADKNNNGKFELSERQYAWKVTYRSFPGEEPVEPVAGDKFLITTTKAFKQNDYFQFTTKAASVDPGAASNEMNKISVVPNPYVSVASWEPRSLNQSGRGERKIDFVHLPGICTIRIYTMAGALVKTLHKDNAADGSLSWNLISEDGMEIAYGVYVFHVDAPGVGEHVGKFAVIK